MRWMLLPLRRYADFNGRSRRREFWMFRLFFYLVLIALSLVAIAGVPWSDIFDGSTSDPDFDDLTPLFWIGMIGAVLWYVGCIVPSIAVCIRRLHDADMSGWLWLLYFVPSVGSIIVIVLACLPGTNGLNRYGPDPKDPGQTSVFS